MAIASWITLSKLSGSGNDTVNASGSSSNTGRSVRSAVITFRAANCPDVTRTVNQAGKPEFVSFDNASASVSKEGGSVTITGKSNSSKLTFSLGSSGDLALTIPASYTAAGVTTSNGTAISGDPGAAQEYAFSITFTGITANTSVDTKTKQLIVTMNDGSTTATCNINQAAGDATLSVTPESVTIPWDASESKSFTVESNASWEIV